MRRSYWRAGLLFILSAVCIFGGEISGSIWDSYTSLDDLAEIEYNDGYLWGAAGGGIFKFRLADSTFSVMTLADGFLGEDFSCIEIDNQGRIWISGMGAAVNIFNPETESVKALNYLSDETGKINDITVSGNTMFAAADNGVFEIYYDPDFDEYFVKGGYHQLGNFNLNLPVLTVIVYQGFLWAGTTAGVARIEVDLENKQPPQYWENFTILQGIPASGANSFLVVNDSLYLSSRFDGIAKYNGVDFDIIPIDNYAEINRLHYYNDAFYVSCLSGIKKLVSGSWTDFGPQFGEFNDFIETSEGSYWGALVNGRYNRGGLKGYEQNQDVWTDFDTNSPAGKYILDMAVDNGGDLWVAGGPVVGKGVYVFDGIEWINYTLQNEEYNVYFYNKVGSTLGGPHTFLEYPNGEMWVGSWGSGMGVFLADSEQLYYNSIAAESEDSLARLNGIDGDETYCVVGEMVLDEAGNIWILNSESSTENPLVMVPPDFMVEHSADVEWLKFSTSDIGTFGEYEKFYHFIDIDQQGRLWMGGSNIDTKGVRCFDFNGTPYDKGDDNKYLFTAANNLLSLRINDLKIDNDNRLWVTTDLGVNSLNLNAPISPPPGFDTPYFLEGIKTKCIAVDAMNNKWFGTNNGVIILGADNYTIVDVYTKETHPLLSNEINSITISGKTGEAFIGTPQGISSVLTPYRSFDDDLGSLEIYPVPFFPGEDDLLRFGDDSLTPNSTAKIFTHTGLLVRKLSFFEASLGWDGRNSEGELVSSGIYLIVVSSPDGQSATGKAAVIRR